MRGKSKEIRACSTKCSVDVFEKKEEEEAERKRVHLEKWCQKYRQFLFGLLKICAWVWKSYRMEIKIFLGGKVNGTKFNSMARSRS